MAMKKMKAPAKFTKAKTKLRKMKKKARRAVAEEVVTSLIPGVKGFKILRSGPIKGIVKMSAAKRAMHRGYTWKEVERSRKAAKAIRKAEKAKKARKVVKRKK